MLNNDLDKTPKPSLFKRFLARRNKIVQNKAIFGKHHDVQYSIPEHFSFEQNSRVDTSEQRKRRSK